MPTYCILLTQSLSGTDAGIPMPAHSLAYGKLNKTYCQGNDKSRASIATPKPGGMKYVADRFTHQYRQVETPHIEAQVLHTLHLIQPNLGRNLRLSKASSKGTTSTVVTLRNTIALIKRNDTSAPFSTIGKRRRNDNHREDVGYHRIGGERTDAASQLLGHHSHGSCRRTDETDEGTLKDHLGLIIITKLEDEQSPSSMPRRCG